MSEEGFAAPAGLGGYGPAAESAPPGSPAARPSLRRLTGLLRPLAARLGAGAMGQAAAGAFLIRIGSAAIAFLSQPLLARLMGSHEFGIYAYAWTWALLVGGIVDLGLGTAAQRFVPEYRETGAAALLNGFVSGSRWLAVAGASLVAVSGALAVWLLAPRLDPRIVVPLAVACATLPSWGLCVAQDGIARSYNWIGVALLPIYIFRPIGIVVLLVGLHFAGVPANAVTIMVATVIAGIAVAAGQTLVINRRLAAQLAAGPRAYDFRLWISTSLPISVSGAFFFLLSYVDVLVLQLYRPPGDIAIYYAVQKLLSLVAFVHFSVAAAAAHRYAGHRASGRGGQLASFHRSISRWTFWPSLAGVGGLLVAGRPLLWLFGPEYVAGYPLIAILGAGLLARAAIGPAERLLTMLGRQAQCAMVYLAALATDVAVCVALVPGMGIAGAAIATALALVVETAALWALTRRALAAAGSGT